MNLATQDRNLLTRLPMVRGRYTAHAPIGQTSWFRTGGVAEVLYKPADRDDLIEFMKGCPSDIPITYIGVCSNLIIRDGGIPGVVIRLGRDFAEVEQEDTTTLYAGAAALDMNVALTAQKFGIGALEFFSGIPGGIGGALRMNAGAYGSETVDVLIEAEALDRDGRIHRLKPGTDMTMTYRHNNAPEEYMFLGAYLKGEVDSPELIESRIHEIKEKRAASQPIKARTGGSTFANPTAQELEEAGLPEGKKTWELIDAVGGRGLMIGGAQMSEKHCNFMINTGEASSSDLEALGEEVRRRVQEEFNLSLRWEIKRIGLNLDIQ